jgi:hypothetical protein
MYIALIALLLSVRANAQQDTTNHRLDSITVAALQDTAKASATDSSMLHLNTSLLPAQRPDTQVLYRVNGTYFGSMWTDLKYTVSRPAHWHKKDFINLGIVVGGAATLAGFDYEIKQFIVRNRTRGLINVTDQIAPFGNQYSPYLLGGMYVVAVIKHDRNLESASLMGAKSLLISTFLYTLTKAVVRRGRPTYYDDPFLFKQPLDVEKTHSSFPSGHMLTVTTVATAFAQQYGKDHPWVPWASYGVALLTGSARMVELRHWSSDVWIGASMGYFITKSIYAHHRQLERKKAMAMGY